MRPYIKFDNLNFAVRTIIQLHEDDSTFYLKTYLLATMWQIIGQIHFGLIEKVINGFIL